MEVHMSMEEWGLILDEFDKLIVAKEECEKTLAIIAEEEPYGELLKARAELTSIPKATIGDVSYYGTLAEPALLVELADTRAENERLKGGAERGR
jgi:hypothetical protein